MQTLEEYKQECLRKRGEKRREKEEAERKRREDRTKRMSEVLSAAVELIKGVIPEPLHGHILFDGDGPTDEQVKDFPSRWMPCDFKIIAPGLQKIHFTVSTTAGVSRMMMIQVGADQFGHDWEEAVAAAAIQEPGGSRK